MNNSGDEPLDEPPPAHVDETAYNLLNLRAVLVSKTSSPISCRILPLDIHIRFSSTRLGLEWPVPERYRCGKGILVVTSDLTALLKDLYKIRS